MDVFTAGLRLCENRSGDPQACAVTEFALERLSS